MKTIFSNGVFEIKESTRDKDHALRKLYFKGKFLGRTKESEYNKDFAIEGAIEEILSIDGTLLPGEFTFVFEEPVNGFLNSLDEVFVYRSNGEITINFIFTLQREEIFNLPLNPFHVMDVFLKSLVRTGYDIQYDPYGFYDDRTVEISVDVPLKGNLFKHYKKHLDVFEKLFAKAEKEVLSRLQKGK